MITYGFSQQGKSHIQKGIVCQDSHKIEILENGWCVLIVADGVGSAKHSEDGSKIAAEMVARYCKKTVQPHMVGEEIIAIIQKAYQKAFHQIELFCQKMDGNIEDYDTTLTTAIYTGKELYFGHAGDGGIIVRDLNGHYEMVTVPQKGVDGISVRPLRAGSDSWDFGILRKKVAAVLLATDGMLDAFLPPLLNVNQIQNNPMIQENHPTNIYVTLAEFFMNKDSVYKNRAVKYPEHFIEAFLCGDITNEQFNQCLENAYSRMFDFETAKAICNTIEQYNYSIWKMDKVTDDRTIVCAINENEWIHTGTPDYYAEPDWQVLQQQFDRLAYPSLYEENNELQTNEYAKMDLEISNNHLAMKQPREPEPSAYQYMNRERSNVSNVQITPQVAKADKYKQMQTNTKKKKRINILIAFAVFIVIGIVGIFCIKHNPFSKEDKDDMNIASNTSASVIDEEKNKQDTEESEADVNNTRSGNEGDTSTENDTSAGDTTEQGITETPNKTDFETVFMLFGKSCRIPCDIDEFEENVMGEKHLNRSEDPNSDIYNFSDNNIELKVETKKIAENTNEETSNTDVEPSSELIESINIGIMNDSFFSDNDKFSVNLSGDGSETSLDLVTLRMSKDEFENKKSNIESKYSSKWEKTVRSYGCDYQIEYNNIRVTVAINDDKNMVKEITVKVINMDDDSQSYAN